MSIETPIPEPGSTAFDVLLIALDELGLPMGGIGREGPWLPQLRAASPCAPSYARIEKSRRDQRARREWSAQPWFRERFRGRVDTTTDIDDLQSRINSFEKQRQERWQPSRLESVCMSAAASKRLGGLVVIEDDKPVSRYPVRDTDLGAFWGMGGRAKTHGGTLYYQQVRPLVRRGDEHWSALGRWPWAAFSDRIPDDWWRDPAALHALQAAHDRAGGGIDLAQRVAAARQTAQALDGVQQHEARAYTRARADAAREKGMRWDDLDPWERRRRVLEAKESVAERTRR